MVRVRQYYDDRGVPIAVPGTPDEVFVAWRSHRRRFRNWFAALSDEDWAAPTRCTEWCVTDMAEHLISGAQFLGYTLHSARKGEGTRLLAAFDAQETPKAAAAMFKGWTPEQLVEHMHAMDASVEKELDDLGDGSRLPAEAPPGRVPAYVSVNHFLFDSWVHERDVMLPAGQVPVLDPNESAVVVSYVMALAGVAGTSEEEAPASRTLRLHVTDLGRDICVEVADGKSSTRFEALAHGANAVGSSGDLVDAATGRRSASSLGADGEAAEFLAHFSRVMA